MSIEDEIYDTNYTLTLENLERRKELPGFSIDDIVGEMEALLIYEGQDWTGRGELKQAEIGGSLLAYQAFLLRNRNLES